MNDLPVTYGDPCTANPFTFPIFLPEGLEMAVLFNKDTGGLECDGTSYVMSELARALADIGVSAAPYIPLTPAQLLEGCNLCGNGVIDPGEVCDGDNLDGEDCFFGGTLACNPTCTDFDTSGCSLCGDGTVQTSMGEECEDVPGGLLGMVCSDFGFAGGNLHCQSNCQFDLSGCEAGLPSGCTPGDVGCSCLPVTGGLEAEQGHPDGADFHDLYCPDDSPEVRVCIDAPFFPQGKCVVCDPTQKYAGCPCEDATPQPNQCRSGLSCLGTDTGSTPTPGRCWDTDDGPPNFQCLAECDVLFDDEFATCYHDHPVEARCLDSNCSPPIAFNCWNDSQVAPVCFDGACHDECDTTQDCLDLGYPAAYECDLLVAGGACRRFLGFP